MILLRGTVPMMASYSILSFAIGLWANIHSQAKTITYNASHAVIHRPNETVTTTIGPQQTTTTTNSTSASTTPITTIETVNMAIFETTIQPLLYVLMIPIRSGMTAGATLPPIITITLACTYTLATFYAVTVTVDIMTSGQSTSS